MSVRRLLDRLLACEDTVVATDEQAPIGAESWTSALVRVLLLIVGVCGGFVAIMTINLILL